MSNHVHSRSCDRNCHAKIRLPDGREIEQGIAASCMDDEQSVRAHVARFYPTAEVLSVTFSPVFPKGMKA